MKLDKRIVVELMRRAGDDFRAITLWKAYTYFLETRPELSISTPGSAVHHILWQRDYPQFRHSDWNLIRLYHEDHTAASALMLGAEPHNLCLSRGFRIASHTIDRSFKPKNSKEVIRLYEEERWGTIRIGKKFGVANTTVGTFLKKYGAKMRTRSRSWGPSKFAGKEIVRLYLKGRSAKSLADRFNVVPETIKRFLKDQGVEIRPWGNMKWVDGRNK